MDIHKKPNRRKSKPIYFRVTDDTYKKLQRTATAQRRDTVANLMYATALDLAEKAEAARG